MINYLKHILKLSKFKENILLTIFWIALILSLNTFPPDFLTQNDYLFKNILSIDIKKGFVNLIEIIRFCFSFFIANSLLVFMFLKTKYKRNNVTLFYILIFLFYLIGLSSLDFYNLFNIERIFLTIFAIGGVIIFQVCNNINNDKNLERVYGIFFLFLMLILVAVFIIYYFIYFKEWFYNSLYLYIYNSQLWQELYFNDPNIRVTGLSRIAIILLIFLISFKSFFSNKNKKYFYLFFFIIIISIWSIQSRTAIYAVPIVILLLTFVFENKSKLQTITIYFLISLFSLVFFEMIIKNIKINYFNKNQIVKIEQNEIGNLKKNEKNLNSQLKKQFGLLEKLKESEFNRTNLITIKKIDKLLTEISSVELNSPKTEKQITKLNQNLKNFTILSADTLFKKTRINPVINEKLASSRFDLWKIALKNYNYKKIFGYGPQADRYEILTKQNILKDKKYKEHGYGYMTNASNAFIYVFLCGGYPALITLILFYIYILYLFVLFINKKLYLKNDNLLNCSIGIIFFLFLRNLVENSNMIFGVDFLLFLISATIFELKVSRIKLK